MNNTSTPVNNVGRPRLELSAVRRRALEQRALQVDRLLADLANARAEVAVVARAGRSDGASIRAIAEAVGLSRARVYELLNGTTESSQAAEAREVGPTWA